LLIEIPKDNIKDFDDFMSIDDVSENLDHSLEYTTKYNKLKPEAEFWGHCSNLQAWYENFYDTTLLHSNIAFPLLKKLTDVGDFMAQRVFKDEIAERLTNLHTNVAQYLIQENYLEYFNREETELLMEILYEQIDKKFKKKHGLNLDDTEIEALLSIIKTNIINSKAFLINRLKHVETINKDTRMGFSYDNKRIIALGFNGCGLKVLPSSIGNLKGMIKLDLSVNHLINLPNEIGNLSNLREFNLDHNIIQFLPDSITKLNKLENLSIWGNQLRDLPKNMSEMISLRFLVLSSNLLEEFPKKISEFPNLETLDLSNNKINTIPVNISYLKSLKALWLNNNPIRKIPVSLLDLQSLTDLYIVNTSQTIDKDKETKKLIKSLKAKGINIWK